MRGKKKKRKAAPLLVLILGIAFGVVIGVLGARYVDRATADGGSSEPWLLIGVFVSLWLSLFLQTVIHEGGHLVCGLISGYRFCSFRIGSLMLVRQQGKLRLRLMSIAGTGGQCLMSPPDFADGRIPVMLYNFGGAIANLISVAVCLVLFFLTRELPVLPAFFAIMMLIGIFYAAVNGIPLRMGAIDNDGYNALSLGKNSAALRSFWIQLKVNACVSEGMRLRDMPSEWFFFPSDEEMKNSMTSVMGVFACNRLMDEQKFAEADQQMDRLLKADTAMVGIHRAMMTCDLMFCELIGQNRSARLKALMTNEQKKMMKAMKRSPSVLRTEYAYALLARRDEKLAQKRLAEFEKLVRSYPYAGDIESERELILIAKDVANTIKGETV